MDQMLGCRLLLKSPLNNVSKSIIGNLAKQNDFASELLKSKSGIGNDTANTVGSIAHIQEFPRL